MLYKGLIYSPNVLFSQGVFLFHIIRYQPLTYMSYQYPAWGEAIGWFMALSSILVTPIYAIYYFFRHSHGTFREVSTVPNESC